MAGSFGGTIKLKGESEYTKALKTITTNLTMMSSEMKLVSSGFSAQDKSVSSLTSKNKVLNKELDEGNKKVTIYKKAIADFDKQQSDNSKTIEDLTSKLSEEKKKLEEMKNSTSASNTEIRAQEKVVNELSNQLASAQNQYDKNNEKITQYKTKLNLAKTEVNNINFEIEKNKNTINENSSAYSKLSTTISEQKTKLASLKTEYGSVVLEQGKNSKQAQELEKEIKTLSGTIKENENKLKDSTKAVDEFSEAEDKAGQSSITFADLVKANLLSDVIKKGFTDLVNLTKQLGNSFINLGKQALDSYAEFEQLEGGVEAMFGGVEKGSEQINIVKETAKSAWKDLTMSQNDYYKTFNSTYPLIASGIEDENEAIATTNKMLQLESDLANTFGYDMTTASNAINWALKGNYSYIDNLNIGIKGTKTGFLEAAQSAGYMVSSVDELSGTEILDVLEKTAGKYGVLGRTASESAGTIQGSVKSMKASWSNMLTGIANDSADFESLTSSLVESILMVLDNILPRIEIIVGGITDLLVSVAGDLFPKIIESVMGMIENIANTLVENMSTIMDSISSIVTTILSTLSGMAPQLATLITTFLTGVVSILMQNLPTIITTIITMVVQLGQTLGQQLPTLIPIIVQGLVDSMMALLDNIDLVIDSGIAIIEGLVTGILNGLPQLIDKMPEIIDKLVTAITDNLPKIIEMGITLIVQLAIGIVKAIPQLVSKIPQIISSLVNGIANYFGKMLDMGKQLLGKVKDGITSGISGMLDVGKNLVKGLWNGINNAKDWVLDKIKGFGKAILNGIKSFFGIHSPSTLFKDEIGKNLALGLGEGFADEMDSVSNEIQNAIPTEFDLGVNTNLNPATDTINESGITQARLVEAFKEALDGMTFKAFDETFGELVIDKVEKVVYS